MQSSGWAPEHSEALRELIVRSVSYGEAADAINAKFGTAYTRSSAIGRGKRMGLATPVRSDDRPMRVPKAAKAPRRPKARSGKARERRADELSLPAPAQPREPVKLRCVGVRPRLVALTELEDGDCRYPYGGDSEGEAIRFCGHPASRARAIARRIFI